MRIVLLAAAGFAFAASAGVLSLVWSNASPAGSGLVSSSGTPEIGGPFTLVDDRGARVTEADLTGRPTALFFGFTWCPDVCPTTLFELASLMEELGPTADEMNFVMVSVDPERDTPEVLHEYVTAFDRRLRAFTGTPEEIARITGAYKVRVERVETERGYTVNHVASVYLMDARNEFVGTIASEEDPATALEKLRRLAARA